MIPFRNSVIIVFQEIQRNFLIDNEKPRKIETLEVFLEAQTGFEPVNQGVADPRLTAWLLRLIYIIKYFMFPMTPTGIEPVLPP